MKSHKFLIIFFIIILSITFPFSNVQNNQYIFAQEDINSNSVVKKIFSGDNNSLILKSDGNVWSTGDNYWGQLGDIEKVNNSKLFKLSNISDVVSASQGLTFSVFLKSDGTVWSLGSNFNGELGDGTKINAKSTPVHVNGLTGIKAVSCGYGHTIALKSDGTVWAWGTNKNGELGDGTFEGKLTPVKVLNIDNIVAISANSSGGHNLALQSDGTVWAWGNNTGGQLGDGTKENKNYPIKVEGLSDIRSIDTGMSHNIALNKYGEVFEWKNSEQPVRIQGLNGIKQIDTGGLYNLALNTNGIVFSWGNNSNGQLGDNTTTNRSTPVQVKNISSIEYISAGYSHSMAKKSDGSIWAWGENYNHQLGDGTYTDRYTPVKVLLDTVYPSVSTTTPLSNTLNNSVYKPINIKFSESVFVGKNYNNIELFDSENNKVLCNKSILDDTLVLSPIGSLEGLENYSVRIPSGSLQDKEENIFVSDYSYSFTTGDPLNINMAISNTVPFANEKNVSINKDVYIKLHTNIKAGQSFNDITVKDNYNNVIPTTKKIVKNILVLYFKAPLKFNNLYTVTIPSESLKDTNGKSLIGSYTYKFTTNASSDILSVSSGIGYNLALRADGKVVVWGLNNYGQLGIGKVSANPDYEITPVVVKGLTDIISVSCSTQGERDFVHSVALKKDGTVWTWGSNFSGQLGITSISDESNHPTPTKVKYIGNVSAISAGGSHTVALKKDGTVWAWGSNYYGQLGDGTLDSRRNPVQVKGIKGVVAISAGARHTLALKKDGTVWAWGDNRNSQLGINSAISQKTTPVQIPMVADITKIDAGYYDNVVLKRDGTAWAWGGADYYSFYGWEPYQFKGVEDIRQVSSGSGKVLAVKKDGTVWRWERNSINGGDQEKFITKQVEGLNDVISVFSGAGHDLAIKSDKTVWAWGSNFSGQLGDGTRTNRIIPVKSRINITIP